MRDISIGPIRRDEDDDIRNVIRLMDNANDDNDHDNNDYEDELMESHDCSVWHVVICLFLIFMFKDI